MFGHQAIFNQINTIYFAAGFQSARASVEPGGPTQRRNIFGNSKPASSEGQNLLTVPGQAPDTQPGDCAQEGGRVLLPLHRARAG